jgi:hypothetical protein
MSADPVQALIDARFALARRRAASPGPRRAGQVRRAVARAAASDRRRLADAAASPRHLHHAEHSRYSQNGEDGVIAEIMRRIETRSRTFVEIGAADGRENCTRALLEQGWSGVWVEGDPVNAAHARELAITRPVDVVEAYVDKDNVAELLRGAGAELEPDVLVIDVDGIDWWIWRALAAAGFRPRVVVVEYNSELGGRARWRLPYDPRHRWDGSSRMGASLAAWAQLAAGLGYVLVGCESMGVNAFFVQRQLAGAFDARPLQRHHARGQHFVGGLRWAPARPFASRALTSDGALALELDRLWSSRPAPGEPIHLTAWVRNGSDAPIGAPADHPVRVAWRWSGDPGEPTRANNAPWRADPGRRALLGCRAVAPAAPGEHQLELALVQEGVRWFDRPGRILQPIVVTAAEPVARHAALGEPVA